MSNITLKLWPNKAKKIIIEKDLSIGYLRSIYDDKIIFPWDSNYDQWRILFSLQIQERPLFIIRATDEKYVLETLNLLKEYKLTIRIVGGRHSTTLQNPDVFLDISSFNKIKLENNSNHCQDFMLNKYLKVGGGATQGDVNEFLFKQDNNLYFPGCKPNHPNTFAFPGGSAATVGVGGISTIGGIGTLRRTLGLTIDSIKSFKIAVPPTKSELAKIITASKSINSDLFWGLLGGGGANFGVITEIKYYVFKINKVVFYQVDFDWGNAKQVIDLWQRTAPSRSNDFNEDLALYNGIDGDTTRLGITLDGIYVIPNGQSISEAKHIISNELKPLCKLNRKSTVKMEELIDYSKLYNRFVASRIYHNFSTARTILTHKCLPSQIIIDRMELTRDSNSYAYIGLQLMGGKISDRNSYETAYYPRNANFFVDIFNFWDNVINQEVNLKWNGKTFKELYPLIGPYCYLGFPVPNLPDHLNAYYGKNKDRLIELKKKIDPLGLLIFPGSL